MTGGGRYEAATLVKRGTRKNLSMAVNRLVVIAGWGHPKLATSNVERSAGSTSYTAKFPAFSKEWDVLLDQYLASLTPAPSVIVDGRTRPTPGRLLQDTVQARSSESLELREDDANSSLSLLEGAVETILATRFERDREARRLCLAHHGYACRCCGLTMRDLYGELGEDYIHVHHKIPLSEVRQEYAVDPVKDLVPLCPNCHAMIHRSTTPLSVEELADIVRGRRRGAAQLGVAADVGIASLGFRS
ncbi:MAG TPA: HNH endonuclease [Polyangiaceae bacterium]|jgi:hypothetical protein|nr:HNH endonuclease [Polyangiaceae bacterium]